MRPKPDAERDLGPDADPESVARKILLDQLTGRARTRSELATKLSARNVPDDIAGRLLDRFEEVGLVDDAAFAREWVEQRQSGRGLARRALAMELRRKGIDDETAREVARRDRARRRGRGRPRARARQAPLGAQPRPRQGHSTPGRHARPQGPLRGSGLPGRQGRAGPGRSRRRHRLHRVGSSGRGSAEGKNQPILLRKVWPSSLSRRAGAPPSPSRPPSARSASGCRRPPRATRVRRPRR